MFGGEVGTTVAATAVFMWGGGGMVAVAGRAFGWGSGAAASTFWQRERRMVMALWGRGESGDGDGGFGGVGRRFRRFWVRGCGVPNAVADHLPGVATASVVVEGGDGLSGPR